MINNKVLKPKSAYTLIELSIVILMISFLMTGSLAITISSLNKAKKISTQNKINDVYNAIGKFLLENKRLPCPASLILTKDNNLYGTESGNGSGCPGDGVFASDNVFYGMIPVKTLNLALSMGEDDFGSKFSYVIDQRFTTTFQNIITNTNTGFGTTSSYNSVITINEKPSEISRTITQDAILIILSHGLNRSGAFNANSTLQNARSTDLDEQSNDYNASFDKTFIYNSQNSKIFDDIVLFKTRNQIVQDFNAFYLIACLNSGFTNQIHAYYDQNIYDNDCAGLNYKKIPEKYCDKFGRWHEINRCGSW